MDLEEAIRAAIEYEMKVFEIYQETGKIMHDPTSKRLIEALMKDEEYHVQYLKNKLTQYRNDGNISSGEIQSTIPSKKDMTRDVNKIREELEGDSLGDKKRVLLKLLNAEIETSRFYRQMVGELHDEGKKLFSRFLEIEDAHITFVRAELDYYSQSGFWLDNKEIDMEWVSET